MADEIINKNDGEILLEQRANLPMVKRQNPLQLLKVADALFRSGMFPNVKNAYGAFSIVQYGNELGIGPMTALQTMAIVKGKICMMAQLMLSMAIRGGVKFEVLKETNTGCQIHFRRGTQEYTAEFNEEDAKLAGLIRPDSGYKTYPKDMYFWRTVARGLRRIAPDLVQGVYAIEEMTEAEIVEESKTVQEKLGDIPIGKLISEENQVERKKLENESIAALGRFMDRLLQCKNFFELKNWWHKHNPEFLQELTADDLAKLTTEKDKMKEHFDKPRGGPEAYPPLPVDQVKEVFPDAEVITDLERQ